MPKFSNYVSREVIKARKVTEKDGESVVTFQGGVIAPKGSYLVQMEDGGSVHVVDAEDFERGYKPASAPAKRTTAKRKPAAKKAPAKPAAKPTAKQTAADRVKAAKAKS